MTYQELVDRSVAERGHPRKYGVDKIKGYNQHHIIPKSMGGTNDGNNIVYFTYAEHLMAHILLFRENPNSYELAQAATFMANKCDDVRDYLVTIVDNENEFNDYIIDLVKAREVANEEHSRRMLGENNPFYGDHRFVGENNPCWGRKHTKEECRKMSENHPDLSGANSPHACAVTCIETNQVFATMTEAQNATGAKHIYKVCDGTRKTSGGYHWMHYDEWLELSDIERTNIVKSFTYPTLIRKVICLETKTIFDSMSMASKGIHGDIGLACKNIKRTAGGYHWMYYDEWCDLSLEKQDNIVSNLTYYTHPCGANNPNARGVICLETLCVYDTVTEAAKQNSVQASKICECCKGNRKRTGGYHWMYYDEYLAKQ